MMQQNESKNQSSGKQLRYNKNNSNIQARTNVTNRTLTNYSNKTSSSKTLHSSKGQYTKKINHNKSNYYLALLLIAVVVLILIIVIPSNISPAVNVDAQNDAGYVIELESNSEITEDFAYYPSYTDKTVILDDQIDAKNAIMINITDSTVLCEKASKERIYPASMVKVMTLLCAVENISDFDNTFEMTTSIIDPLYIENASLAGFKNGEKVVIEDLLYGMVLPSGADSAVALSQYVSGSESNFVKLMNDKANSLGLRDTHFSNVIGLHDNEQYTTAYEMALIMKEAMNDPICAKVLSTYQYTTNSTDKNPDGILLTSDIFKRMSGDEPDGATVIAGKTGYTKEALNTLVTYATDDSTKEEYICVFAGGTGMYKPVFDCINLLSNYR